MDGMDLLTPDLADLGAPWDTGSHAFVFPAQVCTFLSLYWVLALETPDFWVGIVNLDRDFDPEGVSK